MRKKVFQKVLVLMLSQLVITAVCFLEGMSGWEILDYSTYLMISVACAMLLDDFLAKAIWYRYAITRRYLAGILLYFAAIVFFTAAFIVSTKMWAIIHLVLAAASLVGGVVWTFMAYRDDEYVSLEIDRAKWQVMLKGFAKMDREDIEKAVYAFLRFKLKGDRLEGNIDVARPLDPEASLMTIDEMFADPMMKSTAVEAKQYVDKLIEDYCAVRFPAKAQASDTAEPSEVGTTVITGR